MKYTIEQLIPGIGWAIVQPTTESTYFGDVKRLRDQHGPHGVYRLVRTITVKARTVLTSDYTEDTKG